MPSRGGDPVHDHLLDQFSKETGFPRNRATHHQPEFRAWLIVTSLNRLSLDQALIELEGYEAAGQLAETFAAGRPLAGRYPRELTAMQVVRESRGGAANTVATLAAVAASGLPAADQEQLRAFAMVPTASGADLRRPNAAAAAAALPDADLGREIGYELEPSSRPAPAPPVPAGPAGPPGAPPPPPPPPPARKPWDGRDGAPGAAAARAAMQAELFKAFDAYLKFHRPATVRLLTLPRIPASAAAGAPAGSTGLLDIAGQARAVLEARYGVSLDAGASSPGLATSRLPLQAGGGPAGAGPRLFDALSEKDRQDLVGAKDLAGPIAWWIFDNDRPGAAGAPGSRPFASEIAVAHNYSTQDPGAEKFRWQVAHAYAAASTLQPSNERQLTEYRLTVNEADPANTGKGFTLQSSFEPGANRNLAELNKRWEIFQSATHESLHLRTHPGFITARQGRGTLIEGFTEMFTVATLNTDVLPKVRAGTAEPLRRAIEGALAPAQPDPSLARDRVTPAQYRDHRAQAERIRDGGTPPGGPAHRGVGEAAVRAAYFQGHVEYLGLAPDGSQLPGLPPSGAAATVHLPAGISSLHELSLRSGVPVSKIVQDNPGITDNLPAAAVLDGCRDHLVVAGETRDRIAKQNGVSEADLVRANPDLALDASGRWPALAAGRKILIPRH